jgi:hypothetical protein
MDNLQKIDRFGVEAILGRKQFYYGELRRMILAENIVTAYHARAQSESWAAWAAKNPTLERILNEAEILCH